MELAARTAATNGEWWSDAAALRLEAANASGASQDLISSLVLADRALAIRPDMNVAHFNRGLTLERLGLRRSALRAYQHAAPDPEIESHIHALRQQASATPWAETWKRLQEFALRDDSPKVEEIVRAFPQQSRAWAEGECLARWSDAYQAGDVAESRRLLHVARTIGETLQRVNGESLLIVAERTIEAARPESLRVLANAYSIYRRGRIAYSNRNNVAAAADLAESARLFHQSHSPMEGVARYYTLCAQFDEGLSTRVVDELQQLRNGVPGNYRALVSQIDWEIGTVLVNRGDLNDALRTYTASMHGFENLHEEEFAVRLRTMVARTLFLMGQSREAWQMHVESIAAAARSGDDGLLENMLHEAVADEMLDHDWEAARSLAKIALEDVRSTNRRRHFDFVLWRSLLAKPIDLRPVRAAMAGIDDPRLKADAENTFRYAQAAAARDKDPRQAARLFGDCIRYGEATNFSLMLPYLHLERARSLRRAHEIAAAIEELRSAIQLFEVRRQTIERRDFRDAYVGTIDDAFAELLDVYVENGRLDDAVTLAERRRGRVFIDSLGGDPLQARPLSIAEIASRLKAGDLMFIYTEADRHLLITRVERGSWETRTAQTPLASIRSQVLAIRKALLTESDASLHQQVDHLSAILLPTTPKDRTARKLVIVTDNDLRDVPFCLLRPGQSAMPLIEEVAVVRAPSASSYVSATPAKKLPQSVATLADPAFDTQDFGGFSRLPDAAAEARTIASLYPRSTTLVAETATFSNFVRSLPSADVLHVATHAITNRLDPAYSMLLFARDRSAESSCSLRRVASLTLKRGSTVVLAGCSTAVAGAGHGDLRDFANAFLAAGATNTIGTLWDVEDAQARQFSEQFHQQLCKGVAPAIAAQRAQIAMIHSTDENLRAPKAWAAFQVYGTGD